MPVRTGAAALPFPFPCEHGGGGSPVLPPVLAASRIAEADAGAQSEQDEEEHDGEAFAHLCACGLQLRIDRSCFEKKKSVWV